MKKRAKNTVQTQLLDIALLSPWIASRRLARLSTKPACAGAWDLAGMASEKATTFFESWLAMGAAAAISSPDGIPTFWNPSPGKPAKRIAPVSAHAVFARGLQTIHARVKRNAANLKKR